MVSVILIIFLATAQTSTENHAATTVTGRETGVSTVTHGKNKFAKLNSDRPILWCRRHTTHETAVNCEENLSPPRVS